MEFKINKRCAIGLWRPLLILMIRSHIVSPIELVSSSKDLPCHFLDSINITAGFRQPNGSIIFNGISFPKNKIATLDYILVNGTENVPVKPHVRGCLCGLEKPCVRLCCPHGSVSEYTNEGHICSTHESAKDLESEIVDKNNQTNTVKLHEHFVYVDHRPCKEFYVADEFQITHTGDMWHENSTLNHKEYCLDLSLDEETNRTDLELLVCFESGEIEDPRYRFLPIGMLISVALIIVTLVIYSFIPKLRSVHGKCLICYLVQLAIAYSLIAGLQLNGSNYIRQMLCYCIAYTIYFTFLSAFFWLNAMNFDIWQSFQTSGSFQKLQEKRRFYVYAAYGFGIPFLLTFVMFILDSIKSIPYDVRPGLGIETCFMKDGRLSKMLYYHLPLIITFTVNIGLFILIARKFYGSRKSSNDEKSNLMSYKILLYLRLFVVMGILWTFEVISFLIAPNHPVFYLTDILNTLHGVFIFVLFILNRRVYQMLKERWQSIRGQSAPNGSNTVHSNPNSHVLGPIDVHPPANQEYIQ